VASAYGRPSRRTATRAPRVSSEPFVASSDGQSATQNLLDGAWLWVNQVFTRDESVEGIVTNFNRGGLLVRVASPNGGDLPGFVPASHMVGLTRWVTDQDRIAQLGGRVGEQLRLKVIELNREQNRFILSERLAMGRQKDGERLLQTLKVGDTVRGKVNHLTEFGAFVDLGGIDGLLHVTDMAWSRVSSPSDVVHIDQEHQRGVPRPVWLIRMGRSLLLAIGERRLVAMVPIGHVGLAVDEGANDRCHKRRFGDHPQAMHGRGVEDLTRLQLDDYRRLLSRHLAQ